MSIHEDHTRVGGLDWATNPKKRAAVVLEKRGPVSWSVAEVITPVNDQAAATFCRSTEYDLVAVDIPFAWPQAFAEFVSKWTPSGEAIDKVLGTGAFEFRSTELFVRSKTERRPLSVAADKFAAGAWAWADLVHKHQLGRQIALRRDVASVPENLPAIAEVYPAATLVELQKVVPGIVWRKRLVDPSTKRSQWKTYKGDLHIRKTLVLALLKEFGIDAAPDTIEAIVSTGGKDDPTDALLCAVTGAMILGEIPGWTVHDPDEAQAANAKREGWIFFPKRVIAG